MNNDVKLMEYLTGFVSPRRLELIGRILDSRTRHLTVVLEDIFHPPNASAVIRTCEGLGIQDIHVIENEKTFKPNTDVVRGAAKWISLNRFNAPATDNTTPCFTELRNAGYVIVTTTPAAGDGITPEQLPLDHKLAICFGSEENGVSETASGLADHRVALPMYGFTESFNISVAAAMILHCLNERLRKSGITWQLTEPEKCALRLKWLKNSIRNVDKIIERYGADRGNAV